MSGTNVTTDFRAAMVAHGLVPPDNIISDGKIHRCDAAGKNGKGDGAYLLHLDGIPAGGFQNWQNGGWQDWCSRDTKSLTRDELTAFRASVEKARQEREAETAERQSEARERAERVWNLGHEAPADHPYLVSKGIKAPELRKNHMTVLSIAGVDCSGALMVPVKDDKGKLQSVEFITTSGEKRYLPGGRVAGCYFRIGGKPGKTLVIAEGVATAYSVHDATGHPVACAFNAGNLTAVAKVLREKFPKIDLVIAADNDIGSGTNTGVEKAREAARGVGGRVAVPELEGTACDFNDLMRARGAEAVCAGIDGAEALNDSTVPRSSGVAGLAGVAVATDPTPLVRPTPPPAAYPIDALGPVLSPAARAIAEIVQVPHALAANTVLSAAALAAQAQADVQTLGGPRPIALFVLTVLGSGDRKSAADDVALASVRDYVRRMTLNYQTQMTEWERATAARKLDKSRARQEAASGDDYAAALSDIADEPPPRKPWLICSEPTAEGLMRSLAEGQYAQGIYSDEGGQFLGGHALSEESELRTVAMLSRAWQGAPLDRVRATDREHIVLYGRRLSMHLLAQPDVAQRMLGNPLYRSQGWLARWLIAAPDSLAGTRRHNPATPPAQDDPRIRRYQHALSQLLERPPNEDRDVGGLNPPCLALSADARALLVTAYDEIESAQGRDKELEGVREWASKSAEHACRIAGVLTLAADPQAVSVSAETMRGALTLMTHYLGEYMRLVGSSEVPVSIRQAQLLLRWIARKKHSSITPKLVMQFGPSAIRSADAAHSALRTLQDHGWVTSVDGRTYAVHPAALVETVT